MLPYLCEAALKLGQSSSLISIHNVCFHYKIKSEVHLNICNRRKSRQHIQDDAGKGLKTFLRYSLEASCKCMASVNPLYLGNPKTVC